jgi:hypothetical protein
VNRDLALFQPLKLRTPAATICKLVVLFAIGLSKNRIEQLTGVKGETVDNILRRLMSSSSWGDFKDILVRKTGMDRALLHDLDHRQPEMEVTGQDVLTGQGHRYRWCDPSERRIIERKARQIMARKISFGGGSKRAGGSEWSVVVRP